MGYGHGHKASGTACIVKAPIAAAIIANVKKGMFTVTNTKAMVSLAN